MVVTRKLTLTDILNDLRRSGVMARIPSKFFLTCLIEEGILEAVKDCGKWAVWEPSYLDWKRFLAAEQDERNEINHIRAKFGRPLFR